MFKRFGESLSAHTSRTGRRFSRSSSPVPPVPHGAAGTNSTLTTEPTSQLPTSTTVVPTPSPDTHSYAVPVARVSSITLVPPLRDGGASFHHQPTCFRISGIPLSWSTHDLRQALLLIDPELSFTDGVQLSKPTPACCDYTMTAMLNFDQCTAYFGSFERNEERYKVFRRHNRQERLVIDKHFYDLTPLSNPRTPIAADVIAITGLGGHAFGSWRGRASTDRPIDRPMWLRDFLPVNFANIRIMTYGYDSSLKNPNGANLTDYRRNFRECLQNARRDCPERPIIFIGHSLGGLLIVQTLIECSQYSQYPDIRDCILGIFFFGTPHQGLRTVELCNMFDEQPDADVKVRDLLAQLHEGSEYLENQQEALREMWDTIRGKVITFYETETTKSVKKVAPGVFRREGVEVQMVQRLSAQLYLPKEHRFPVTSNHRDIVKFDSQQCRTYQTVVTYMKDCLDQVRNERVVESLSSFFSAEEFGHYYCDQKAHLDALSLDPELENGKLFWIFKNIDYTDWKNVKEGASVLILRGSRNLEDAASQIIRKMTGNKVADLVLHFFYSSLKRLHTFENLECNWQHVSCVWTLLIQTIEGFPLSQKQCLLTVFFSQALDTIGDEELAKMLPDKPMETIQCLLLHSDLRNLWVALAQTLGKSEQLRLRGTEPKLQTSCQTKRNLAMVFDLNDFSIETYKLLIGIIRGTLRYLRQYYSSVKILLVNPPPTGDLELRESEVLVEYDRERQECLKTLHVNNTRYSNVTTHHKDTFEWLWTSLEYVAWSCAERSSLLLIDGKPGSGKSTLVRYFKDHHGSQSYTVGDHAIVSDFFYSRRDGESERSHCNMLRSLLYDILAADESFFIHFQEQFRHLGGEVNVSWPYGTLKSILLACRRHPLKRTLVFIVDAIDESDETDRWDATSFLLQLSTPVSTNCVVKVFLASRPINELQQDPTVTCNCIRLQERNKEDIYKYTDAFLGDQVFCHAQGFKKQAQEYIVQHADGVFLWVSLIRKALVRYASNGRSITQLMTYLKGLPMEIASYYVLMLEALESGDPDDIRDGRRVLQFCLFSHRAVKLIELDHALAIPSHNLDTGLDTASWEARRPIDIRKRVTHCAGNFVEIGSRRLLGADDREGYSVVQVMHQTVREFFRSHCSTTIQSPFHDLNEKEALSMIKLTCVQYLMLHYREITLNFPKPADKWSSADYHKFVQYLDTRAFIKYALENLTQQMGDINPDVTRILSEFINKLQKSPSSPAFCLLKLLAADKTDRTIAKEQRNKLLQVAATQGCVMAMGSMLAAAADCDSVDKYRQSLLHLAAKNGHVAAAQYLLDHGANIHAKDSRKWTALHVACLYGHMDITRLLLQHEATIETGDNDYMTPLHLAAVRGHNATVRLLLDHNVNIEVPDCKRQTALHMAAGNGHEATIQVLMEDGAQIEALTSRGATALHLASMYGHSATVRLLLEYNANIEAQDSEQLTALHLASKNGHSTTVQLLLDRGANIRAQDTFQSTALLLAAGQGQSGTVSLLLDNSASIEDQDRDGWKALHLASGNNHETTVRLLIACNAYIEAQSALGRTALHLATEYGFETIARLLLDSGANIEAQDLDKETAVHMASRNNHVETVQLLIARNANIEARSYLGRTALHMTAQYGCEATAKLLLDHGANIEAQDLDNKTAIHIASWINHDETARLLIANNANIGAQSDLERLARAEISYGDEDISYYTYYSTNREERDCFISAAKNLVAAVKGDSAMVKFLLDCGANIEARDSQQQTALHLAASVGHDTTVWLLRIRGANIDSKDRHNKTPKDLAKEKAYTLTAQLLPSQLPSQSQLSQPPSWQSRRVRPHPAYDPVVSTRTKKSQGC